MLPRHWIVVPVSATCTACGCTSVWAAGCTSGWRGQTHAWACGQVALVVAGSLMHATGASSAAPFKDMECRYGIAIGRQGRHGPTRAVTCLVRPGREAPAARLQSPRVVFPASRCVGTQAVGTPPWAECNQGSRPKCLPKCNRASWLEGNMETGEPGGGPVGGGPGVW